MGYFKGWYFKCCTENQTIAFIPAYHSGDHKASASLQIITDESTYCIPFCKIEYREHPLSIQLGDCLFSEQGISLHLQDDNITADGLLRFQPLTPIRYDIMGPFALVPFMQCRHSIYSMTHKINGRITVGSQQFDFHDGVGYIEGDRGYSFPNQYIWTQCCFARGSLMLSIADIPLLGGHFTGIIGVVLLDGKEYRIATYLGARVKRIKENTVVVRQGNYELVAKLLKKNSHPLFAPENGNMCRTIYESASCTAYYRFSYKHRVSCEFSSDKASFEFEYDAP